MEIDNKKIGIFLEEQINKYYKTKMDFYRDLVLFEGIYKSDDPYFEDEAKRVQNRFRHILTGYREIQLYDLKGCSKLLKLTYEEILSGSFIDKYSTDKTDSLIACKNCNFKYHEELNSCPCCGWSNKDFIKVEMSHNHDNRSYEGEYEASHIDHILYKLHTSNEQSKYYDLMKFYLNSNFLKDDKKAYYWAKEGSNHGDIRCIQELANSYLYGRGTDKDVNSAIELLEKYQENLYCKYLLAKSLSFFNSKYKNIKRGIELFTDLVKIENGNFYEDSVMHLGILYFEELKDYENAFKYLSKLKETYLSPKVNYYLGLCYKNGWGIPQDYIKAKFYFNKGKDVDLSSKIEIADLYAKGLGICKDTDKALKILNNVYKVLDDNDNERLEKIKKLNNEILAGELNA